MNLLEADWIPVRRRDGSQSWISPLQISDPEVVALAANRADFNGALAQFLIGLLQTTTPMDSLSEWEAWLYSPPAADVLAKWFAPVKAAFMLDGDGPRFMQDLTILDEKFTESEVAPLLIDHPRGRDHFVKYGSFSRLCVNCTSAALVNIQSMAPEGGRGYFTSIRGGGPLTTLVIATPPKSLWADVWLNVMRRSQFDDLQGRVSGNLPLSAFPWMSEGHRQGSGDVYPANHNPALVYWAMPRRFLLDFDSKSVGTCDVCSRVCDVISLVKERPHGTKYSGWNHPLTPYRESDQSALFPVRPKGGDLSYRHWVGWVQSGGKSNRPASVISDFLENKHTKGQFRVWAFGYHMEKANAKAWCESTFPLYGLSGDQARSQETVHGLAVHLVAAAEFTCGLLRDCVKDAWFKRSAEVKNELSPVSGISSSFYSATEPAFYDLLRQLIDSLRDPAESTELAALREHWLRTISDAALRLFDETFVGSSPIEAQNPRRVAEAHRNLVYGLRGDKIRKAVGLSVTIFEKAGKGIRKKKVIKEA